MGGQTGYCRPGCKCINCENVQHPCVPHVSPDEDPLNRNENGGLAP